MATLDEWEHWLSSQMGAIELIGELDLAPEQIQEIGRLIASFICSREPQLAMRSLEQRYPATLATFLVFQGGNSYHSNEKGDFWPGVCEAAGIPYAPSYTMELGQAFKRICARFGLPHECAGHRYVGAILGHGGIPARCLPDFFEHMLQPSITKPELAALPTADLIQEWLTSSTQYYVDRPILRFLEYGGKVAEDFVERCRQMARAWADEKEFPTADELGLPAALVDAYHEWMTQSGLARAEKRSGLRLKKPAIVLDPWGQGVHVVLPEQQIPAAQSLAESWWEVEANGTTEKIPVNTRRVDVGLETRITCAPLRGPAPEYKVRFYYQAQEVDTEMLREWVFEGVSATHPFLVFDPTTGRLMPQPNRLPARPLWILCPPDAMLQSNPTGQALIQERLPQLPWDWHTWRGYRLNLQGINTLSLSSSFGQVSLPIIKRPPGLTAELVNGAQLDSLEDQVPIFVGAPPTLRIYMQGEEPPGGRPERWHLEFNHEWEADPKRAFKSRLSELHDLMVRWNGCIELPLSHPRLLGPAPVGQYRIRLRGPLGRNADLRFRVAPKLYLTGHEGLYLPKPDKGAPTALLLIETDAQSQIELLEDAPDFRVELLSCDAQVRCYQVAVPPDRAEAPLRLVRPLPSGRRAYLPLHIPIRRLRWLLILKPEQVAQATWQSHPSTISLAELEQSSSPYLMLELPVPENSRVAAWLRFLDVNGGLIAELEAPGPSGSRSWRRFDLRAVRDALRVSQSPAIQVVLQVQGLPEHGPLTLTVLTIRRSIAIQRASITLHQLDGAQLLEVSWEPEIPLRNRFIRLWSQTRPWTEPLLLPIPDSAKGSYAFSIQADALPAGRYLVEFLVHDPWLPETTPARPEPTAPHVVTVTIGSLEERLARLEAARRENGDVFSCACESAFLWRTLGETARAEASLQACWECRSAASLPQMMALARQFRDLPTGKAFRIGLYRTEQIREILTACYNYRLPESLVAEYFADLPPLAELEPQAIEALLDAPDERVQLAAARHLIEQGKEAGVAAALAWAEQGKLSQESFRQLMGLNTELASRYVLARMEQRVAQLPDESCVELAQATESEYLRLAALRCLIRRGKADGIQLTLALQARHLLDTSTALQLLELQPELTARVISSEPARTAIPEVVEGFMTNHPDLLPSIRVGAWVRCTLGWGEIRFIRSLGGQPLLFAPKEVAANGIVLGVRLHLADGFSDSTIQMGRSATTIRTGPRLYICAKCESYVARNFETVVGRHYLPVHGSSREQKFRFLPSGLVVNQAEPLEFSDRQPS
jgi:hypothetical protein